MSRRAEERAAERERVFTAIYAQHCAAVQSHAECTLDDDSEVAEVVADVFLLAWRKLDPACPLGLVWLLRACDNKLKDRDRSERAHARAIDAVRTGHRAPQGDLLDALAVRRAIDTVLTPRERRIVILAYWDRLAAGEIAELLRCSQGTVWTTLSRARRKLQSELGLSPIASAPRVEALSIARAGNTLRPSISAPGV